MSQILWILTALTSAMKGVGDDTCDITDTNCEQHQLRQPVDHRRALSSAFVENQKQTSAVRQAAPPPEAPVDKMDLRSKYSISENGLGPINVGGRELMLTAPGALEFETCCHLAKDKPTRLSGDLVLAEPTKHFNKKSLQHTSAKLGAVPELMADVIASTLDGKFTEQYLVPTANWGEENKFYNFRQVETGEIISGPAWPSKIKDKELLAMSAKAYIEKEEDKQGMEIYSDHVTVKRDLYKKGSVHSYNAAFPLIQKWAINDNTANPIPVDAYKPWQEVLKKKDPTFLGSEELLCRGFFKMGGPPGNKNLDHVHKYIVTAAEAAAESGQTFAIIGVQEMVDHLELKGFTKTTAGDVSFDSYMNRLGNRLGRYFTEKLPGTKLLGAAYTQSGPEGSAIFVVGPTSGEDVKVDPTESPWLDFQRASNHHHHNIIGWANEIWTEFKPPGDPKKNPWAIMVNGRTFSALVVRIHGQKTLVLNIHAPNPSVDKSAMLPSGVPGDYKVQKLDYRRYGRCAMTLWLQGLLTPSITDRPEDHPFGTSAGQIALAAQDAQLILTGDFNDASELYNPGGPLYDPEEYGENPCTILGG